MKTKDKIVERLIENKHITAEEAVVLLKEVNYQGTFTPAAPYKHIKGECKNGPLCYCNGDCRKDKSSIVKRGYNQSDLI